MFFLPHLLTALVTSWCPAVIRKEIRSATLIISLSFIAGVIGILLGHKYIMPNAGKTIGLHEQIHNEFLLDAVQSVKLAELEEGFSIKKSALESRMKKANIRLSAAMQKDHTMSPEVVGAKQEYVQVLDELQTLTLEHIFMMRDLLNENQAVKFDEIIQRSFSDIAK